ncbi:MAG: D-glycero-beta-D-manno-heptose 1-phosphate adenylyltransferase [Nitrospirales bacterium]|nr:D-glycero-beta-D-manno-heptose 1-phosphate adenylyltransferase [Nitrospira sp.]MCB9711501.1 D-glycero-beta-D-manno-heptose 1-phosphate adenylyltransferase [Nitrospiraceae bacterium]MDR4487386.1 D-glycero-beta-D-manno-heptose 1-phosphate adenylyltransferase [Nitrospirales bacterium]
MKQKIYSLDQLIPLIAAHRQVGESIVFTNGCFDLLHIGHVRYLQAAKHLGDRLVVGINSDQSVRKLSKGTGRPFIPDHQRAEIISALGCVDYVMIFDEADPLNLIKAIQPQVLVKGGDWTPDRIVGREFVEKRGGTVRSIPLTPESSTSLIVQKILATHGVTPTVSDSSHVRS